MFYEKHQIASALKDLRLKKLTSQQVEQIDELLGSLKDQGEVRLIIQRGVLKYINRVERDRSWNADEPDETPDT